MIEGGPDGLHLALAGETLSVGGAPGRVEGVFRDLRVVRVRCEVEVDEDRPGLPVEEPGVIAPRVLEPGPGLPLGHLVLSLTSATPTAAPSAPVAPPPAPVPGPAAAARRLKVTDGGDQGRSFRLPDSGTLTVGKTGGHADVGLHDLYVSRIHCMLQITPDAVTVVHVEGANGTLVDGRKISGPHALAVGGVLRVGNSHLRLEAGPFPDEDVPPPPKPVSVRGPGSAVMRAVAADTPAPSPKPPKGDPIETLEGSTFGPYRVGKLLGRGFVGAVYQAANAATGQAIALKVLAAEFPASQVELEQFAEELQAAQGVRHPHLVALFGAGRTGPHCWVAREYVEGESAAAVVARIAGGEKPSWTRAARVAVHLARALDFLHGQRLVHANITPKNVLIQAGDHVTRLTDLGLGEVLRGSRLQKAVQEKKLLAELPYLAPEQAEPGAFVDNLADLYAVGALAYALTTGRPPAAGATAAEVLEQVKAGRVPKPSLIYKKCPATFDAIVMKLLARRQEDRYQTAGRLLADLEPLAAGHDVKV
ncbi:MAG: hypothetical protein C0501_06660 [Isosphaera sp.]|nr:hypothetical protein [Isosphaera sp.]